MPERVIELFHRSIEAKMSIGESLSEPLVAIAERLTAVLEAGNKVLVAGAGLSVAVAETFDRCMSHGHRMERPGLPSVSLRNELLLNPHTGEFTESLGEAVSTLGNSGDTLLLFGDGSGAQCLQTALESAHFRGMPAAVLTATGDEALAALCDSGDIELHLPCEDQYRVQELLLLSAFCLCDLIEYQLFGGGG